VSRSFSSFGTDLITVDPSSSAPVNQGGITVMGLVKTISSADQWVVQGYDVSNNPCWGMLASGGVFYNEGNFGSGNGSSVVNDWMWVCYTKASGSVKPRWHTSDLTAASGWSHADDGSNVSDLSGPPTTIVIGGRQQGNSSWRGNIAAIAVWDSVLSDSAIEAAAVSAAALQAAIPSWGVLLNQASTATDVTDLSGNGATQASITGTSVSADEPAGWSYALSSGPTFKVWNGSAEVDATLKVWNGSAEVDASISSIV
jgi:hypothetical protein